MWGMTTKQWTAIGAIAAIVAVVVAFVALDGNGGDTTTIKDSTLDSGDGCTNIGQGAQNCYVELVGDLASRTEADIIEAARRAADKPPASEGPWPFYVVRTAPIGLKVRSTNEQEATQLGGIANLNSAWAWCQQTSDFDPDPGDDVPGLWLQIAWDHQEPNTTDYFQSELGADARAWIYAGFTVPTGHSGDIPRC